MRQYSTPVVEVVVEGIDATAYRAEVTLRQGGRRLTLVATDKALEGEDTVLRVPLTQAQTGIFVEGEVEVQVDLFDGAGHRVPTDIGTVRVDRTLHDVVVEP